MVPGPEHFATYVQYRGYPGSRLRSRHMPPVILYLGMACVWGCGNALGQSQSAAESHAAAGQQLAQTGDIKGAEAELRQAAELSPKDPAILANLAQVLESEGRLAEARSWFERALQLDPNNLAVRENLAVTQWRTGLFTEARANLELVLKSNSDDARIVLLLGMVEENSKNYQRARDLLASVPALVRQRPESIAALAHSYYETGERKKARDTLEELENRPGDPTEIVLAGQIAARANDFEVAQRMFGSIPSTYSDRVTLGYELALMQYRANRLAESRATLRQIVGAGHETSEIDNLLGKCLYKQGNFTEALKAMQRAIEIDPSKLPNYLDVGTMLRDHHQLPAALVMAERAVEVAPSSYEAYSFKGLVESKLLKLTDAEKSYARAAELNPAAPEALMGQALAEWDAGRTPAAEATFKKGIERFPQNADFYQEYGIMLLDTKGTKDASEKARAVTLLRTAIHLNDSLAEPHYRLGALALAEGRLQEALDELRKAAKLNSRSSKIHYALARAYTRLGRSKEASAELRAYQTLSAHEERTEESAAKDNPKPTSVKGSILTRR